MVFDHLQKLALWIERHDDETIWIVRHNNIGVFIGR